MDVFAGIVISGASRWPHGVHVRKVLILAPAGGRRNYGRARREKKRRRL